MKTQEEVHSELCMLYSRRDVHAHSWARGELASQSLLDDIWGKIYALRWVLGKNIQWGVADQPDEKGEAGPFEKWPLMCYCYPGCEMPKAAAAPLADPTLKDLEGWDAIATPGPWLYKPEWLDWVLAVQDTRPGYTDDWLRIAERANQNPADRQQANFSLIAAMRNALPGLLARVRQAEAKALPSTLSDDLTFILGRPNFWCAPYARGLRALGQQIPTHAEEEQAAVIHWLLQHYLANPTDWREAVKADLEKATAALATSDGKETSSNEAAS